MSDKLLTVKQAAAILRVTPGRVRQLLLGGKLRGVKFGRDWQIDKADVERYQRVERG